MATKASQLIMREGDMPAAIDASILRNAVGAVVERVDNLSDATRDSDSSPGTDCKAGLVLTTDSGSNKYIDFDNAEGTQDDLQHVAVLMEDVDMSGVSGDQEAWILTQGQVELSNLRGDTGNVDFTSVPGITPRR